MMKNEVSERAGHEANARPIESVPQEDMNFCAHRGHGCISQNGYMCTNGPKCEPMDENGRRFVVYEWIENGQRLASRTYLDGGELSAPQKEPVAPVIDSDAMNARLRASRNPRAALQDIHTLAAEARQDIRNGNTDCAFAKLNRIALLTGGVS